MVVPGNHARPADLTVAASLLGIASTVPAAETASTSVVVSAQFSSRTTLNVSTEVLCFDVDNPGEPAEAVAVDFAAAARTLRGRRCCSSVEQAPRPAEGPVPRAMSNRSVSFVGQGNGALDGASWRGPPGARRAHGSGSGTASRRLMFALRAAASGR